jgi:uncharacterized protein YndB with AHSA1/START domain
MTIPALSLDYQFTTTVEKLWSALTDSGKLAKWITENDFKPVVGHQFRFRHQAFNGWDGIIDGEVVAVDPPDRLSYTWTSAGERHSLTWTLQDLGDGKVNLHLEQTGFSNVQGLEGARYGWGQWFGKLEKELAR